MKKYILALFLIALIVPSVALASWWNPLSWRIFSFLHKKEVIPQVQKIEQKTPEEKINELQRQLDELKSKDNSIVSTETKKEAVIKPKIEIKKDIVPITDVCLNIDGIQAIVPVGYSLADGGICSLIVLTDLCPNYTGVQSVIPAGMYIYGDDKQCLTRDEIEEIVIAKAQAEVAKTPIESSECKNAISKWKSLSSQLYNIENLSDAADFAVFEVNPARREVDTVCELNTPIETIQPTKSTYCYANYYGSNASITCYGN